MILAIDHVQLAMPAGGEPMARQFYAGMLGLDELPKPPALAARGGAWFGRGSVQLHLGVEADFRPARKAHPALLVDDLDGLLVRLRAQGVAAREDDELPGYRRAFVADPFGNRIELMQPISSS
jgi:catechol 2,3-dioxygenase-like lactoylglutathione lyase family enzyme